MRVFVVPSRAHQLVCAKDQHPQGIRRRLSAISLTIRPRPRRSLRQKHALRLPELQQQPSPILTPWYALSILIPYSPTNELTNQLSRQQPQRSTRTTSAPPSLLHRQIIPQSPPRRRPPPPLPPPQPRPTRYKQLQLHTTPNAPAPILPRRARTALSSAWTIVPAASPRQPITPTTAV